jgi:hypothetical protein
MDANLKELNTEIKTMRDKTDDDQAEMMADKKTQIGCLVSKMDAYL